MRTLDAGSVQCCVTSPPYWGLRDYGCDGQLGLEPTPAEYVANLVEVFREVRRVLADDGTLWLNLGDSYAGSGKGPSNYDRDDDHRNMSKLSGAPTRWLSVPAGIKPKDLIGIPWRVAFALQEDGWWLRSDIIWHKPNPMPSSVTDRPTSSHEHVFLMTKSRRYFYDAEAIAEPCSTGANGSRFDTGKTGAVHPKTSTADRVETETRNARDVWTITTKPYSGAHFATMPPDLAQRCILAGSRPGDTVLDPFMGSGTVGMVAQDCGRRWIGCELNEEYGALIEKRTAQQGLGL